MQPRSKKKFTKAQIETAIQVLMETDMVKNWAEGELRAFGVQPDAAAGAKFIEEQKRKVAERIVKTAV